MLKSRYITGYRIALGFFILFAILYQLAIASHAFNFSIINFFSYFTVLGNIFFGLLLLVLGFRSLFGRDNAALQSLRGAALLYMSMTGIIFLMLLAQYEPSLINSVGWVNALLHYIVPLIAIADWIIDAPSIRISFRSSLLWLVFPVYFLIYSIARGQIIGWYPYPFLDVSKIGFGTVLLLATTITICVSILGLFIALTSRLRAS